MKNSSILILLIMVFLTGTYSTCEEDPLPPMEEFFEVQWATRIEPEIWNFVSGDDGCHIYKDWLLIGGDLDEPPTIYAFDKESGELAWKYVHEGVIKYEIRSAYIIDNIYFGVCPDGFLAFDLEEGELLYEYPLSPLDMSTLSNPSVQHGNHIVIRLYKGRVHSQDRENFIWEVDPATGEFTTLFEGVHRSVSLPVFYKNSEGVEYMLFNESRNNEQGSEGEQDMICINVETGEEVWKTVNFTDNFPASNVPVIYKDLVLTGGDYSIYALDVHTGEVKWRYQVPGQSGGGGWGRTNHLVYGGRLYVNNQVEDAICLDARTGEELWINKESTNCTQNMLYYEEEDYLLYGCLGTGSVMVIDALTGETVHYEHGYEGSIYTDDVIYESETEIFYTKSYAYAVAFKLNSEAL